MLAENGVSPLAVALALGRRGIARAMTDCGGNAAIAAGQVPLFFGDPDKSFDGMFADDALNLNLGALETLKDRLRDTQSGDLDSWLGAVGVIVADLGGNASGEIARLRSLAI